MQAVIPGDLPPSTGARPGPGIHVPPGENPVITAAGRFASTGKVDYVEASNKRYIPALRDSVIGIISQRLADVYRVTLQEKSKPVRLGHMSFESASRKNKPNLQPGDVVYARVVKADALTEPELEAFDSATGKSGGFGQLKEGTLISVGLAFARHLLFKGHPILEAIGTKYTFEMAIGVNGLVWVKTEDAKTTLQICNWISQAEHLPVSEALRLVR